MPKHKTRVVTPYGNVETNFSSKGGLLTCLAKPNFFFFFEKNYFAKCMKIITFSILADTMVQQWMEWLGSSRIYLANLGVL